MNNVYKLMGDQALSQGDNWGAAQYYMMAAIQSKSYSMASAARNAMFSAKDVDRKHKSTMLNILSAI